MEHKQLALVREQMEQKQQKLAERLEKAIAFIDREREQLSQLQDYENGYRDKIQSQQQQWTADNVNRYRQFCYQLSSAINAQAQKLQQAEQQTDTIRQQLREQQQQLNVLDEIIEREQLATATVENRLLQKEMDELSARRRWA